MKISSINGLIFNKHLLKNKKKTGSAEIQTSPYGFKESKTSFFTTPVNINNVNFTDNCLKTPKTYELADVKFENGEAFLDNKKFTGVVEDILENGKAVSLKFSCGKLFESKIYGVNKKDCYNREFQDVDKKTNYIYFEDGKLKEVHTTYYKNGEEIPTLTSSVEKTRFEGIECTKFSNYKEMLATFSKPNNPNEIDFTMREIRIFMESIDGWLQGVELFTKYKNGAPDFLVESPSSYSSNIGKINSVNEFYKASIQREAYFLEFGTKLRKLDGCTMSNNELVKMHLEGLKMEEIAILAGIKDRNNYFDSKHEKSTENDLKYIEGFLSGKEKHFDEKRYIDKGWLLYNNGGCYPAGPSPEVILPDIDVSSKLKIMQNCKKKNSQLLDLTSNFAHNEAALVNGFDLPITLDNIRFKNGIAFLNGRKFTGVVEDFTADRKNIILKYENGKLLESRLIGVNVTDFNNNKFENVEKVVNFEYSEDGKLKKTKTKFYKQGFELSTLTSSVEKIKYEGRECTKITNFKETSATFSKPNNPNVIDFALNKINNGKNSYATTYYIKYENNKPVFRVSRPTGWSSAIEFINSDEYPAEFISYCSSLSIKDPRYENNVHIYVDARDGKLKASGSSKVFDEIRNYPKTEMIKKYMKPHTEGLQMEKVAILSGVQDWTHQNTAIQKEGIQTDLKYIEDFLSGENKYLIMFSNNASSWDNFEKSEQSGASLTGDFKADPKTKKNADSADESSHDKHNNKAESASVTHKKYETGDFPKKWSDFQLFGRGRFAVYYYKEKPYTGPFVEKYDNGYTYYEFIEGKLVYTEDNF